MKPRVMTEIQVYEVNGKDSGFGLADVIKIHSHWNMSRLVVLEIDGKRTTVSAHDLEVAIQNASRS